MVIRVTAAAALSVTVAALVVWLATEAHYYTKFQVVEQVEIRIDADDPLLAAGFYDDEVMTETVTRDAFHLGLLPTPQGFFDRHVFAVSTIAAPLWIAFVVALLIRRLRPPGARVVARVADGA